MGGGKSRIGLLNQAIRRVKQAFQNLFRRLLGKKRRRKRVAEPSKVPRSWQRGDPHTPRPGKPRIIYHNKKRVPGLRFFKRLLAGFLLLINFSFSQFLLGSMNTQAQPMFVLFLLNSFILLDYLWKTRGGSR